MEEEYRNDENRKMRRERKVGRKCEERECYYGDSAGLGYVCLLLLLLFPTLELISIFSFIQCSFHISLSFFFYSCGIPYFITSILAHKRNWEEGETYMRVLWRVILSIYRR